MRSLKTLLLVLLTTPVFAIDFGDIPVNTVEPSSVWVPPSRTLTIDGVAHDLSIDRSWTTSGGITPAALTRTNDTNVTLTLGGTPATALLQATSLTLGWTGTLAVGRGGTGVSSLGNITKSDDTNVTLTLGGTPTGAVINSTSFTLGWTGQLALSRGGTGTSLTDPNADTLMGWDDVDGAIKFFTIGGGLTYTHSTHTLAAAGGGGGTVTSITATAPIVVTPTPLTTTGVISITGAALTKTDDTNVTLTLGGAPTTALLGATSITVGWTGTLAVSRGGTGAATAAANTVFGNNTGSTAAPGFQTLVDAQVPNTLTLTAASNLTTNGFVKTSGGVGTLSVDTSTYLTGNQTITLTGDVTGSGTTAITTVIANDAVTYAKMQNVAAASRLLGRGSAGGSGDPEEITLGTNLSMSGTTLNATGAGSIASTTQILKGDGAGAAIAGENATPAWTGQHTWTFSDAVNNAITDVLTVGHNSSGTPAANYGTGILLRGQSNTTTNQPMGEIAAVWQTATHASRVAALALTAYDFGGTASPVYIWPGGGISTNNLANPGTSVIRASGGFRTGSTATAGTVLMGGGTVYDTSGYTFPTSVGSAGGLLRSNGSSGYLNTTAAYPNTAVTDGNVLTVSSGNWVESAPTGGGAGTGLSYITKVAEGTLSNEFALGSLATGILKNTTTTGIPTIAVAGTDYQAPITTPSGAIVGTTDTQTLTNKRITKRVLDTNVPSSPVTPDGDSYDGFVYRGINAALTLNAFSGTPTAMQPYLFRFKDDGTGRALTFTTGSSKAFRAIVVSLPTTTVANKTTYLLVVYNATDDRLDTLATGTEP